MKTLLNILFFIFSWSVANGQTNASKNIDFYFHRIVLYDSAGKKIDNGWKIGVNGDKKYATIRPKDTNDIIISGDAQSEFYIFYAGKDYSFHISDLNLFSQNIPEKTFNYQYEYNLYIQLPKNCMNTKYLIFVKNTFWKKGDDGSSNFGINKITVNQCDYKIYFLGNYVIQEKGTRKYRRLKNEYPN